MIYRLCALGDLRVVCFGACMPLSRLLDSASLESGIFIRLVVDCIDSGEQMAHRSHTRLGKTKTKMLFLMTELIYSNLVTNSLVMARFTRT